MPGMMDLAEDARDTHHGQSAAITMELRTARRFGKEIRRMSVAHPSVGKAAQIELVPDLETLTDAALIDSNRHLALLRRFNEKARKWIDTKNGLTP